MISVLFPTRKRPAELQRAVDSLRATAELRPLPEVVLYVDDDDRASAAHALVLDVKCKVGPRIRAMTQYWNECLPLSTGDIMMLGNDDVVFRTQGWDRIVEEAFAAVPDKILMVHGSDEGQHFDRFGAHPFVHRRWVDTLGYFLPPYFSSDYGDTWLNSLANALGRRKYVPIVVDHLHFMFKKAPLDQTYRERLERHKQDKVDQLWTSKLAERRRDAAKLAAVMEPPLRVLKAVT